MVVAVGVTLFEVLPSTEPTPLSMDKVVTAPPESFHDNVVDCPFIIVADLAVNELIIGDCGFTVMVTGLVDVP